MERELTYIERILWGSYIKWKAGDYEICDYLGYESTMVLIPQFHLTTNNSLYIIDFVEPTMKIAIELDGFHWHYKNEIQIVKDKVRERAIILEDYTIMRYTGKEVCKDPAEVLKEIYHCYCLKCINKSKEVIVG